MQAELVKAVCTVNEMNESVKSTGQFFVASDYCRSGKSNAALDPSAPKFGLGAEVVGGDWSQGIHGVYGTLSWPLRCVLEVARFTVLGLGE